MNHYYSMMGKRPDIIDTAVYIDPTNVASGRNGTIGNPYNSFTEAGIADNTMYLWKAGTTQTTSTVLNLSNRIGVIIGQYGSGAKPKLNFTGSGDCAIRFANSTNCTLSFIDVSTNLSNSVLTLIQMGVGTTFDGGTGNIIYNCDIHNVKQCSVDGGMGIRGGGVDLKILNCNIYDVGCDGIYLQITTNAEIGYCNVWNVNQNYAGASKGFQSMGDLASGDCIQFTGLWDNAYVHHCTLERMDEWTGNKFALIYNSASGTNANSYALTEYCTFNVKYAAQIDYAVYCEKGNGVEFRFNKFTGGCRAIRVTGPEALNYLIHHNIFISSRVGIGIVALPSGNAAGSPVNTRVFNNTFHKSVSYDIGVDGTQVVSRNNIHHPDGTSGVALSASGVGTIITHSNNCYSNGALIGTGGTAPNSVIGNPLFVDALNGDYHLQAESPCKDTGINVGLTEDYYGEPISITTSIGASEL